LAAVVYAMAVGVSNIADVILVLGATASTAVGFNLPMLFYLKLDEEENGGRWSLRRVAAHTLNIGMVCMSISSLYYYAINKLQQ
jgi:amino acid permease